MCEGAAVGGGKIASTRVRVRSLDCAVTPSLKPLAGYRTARPRQRMREKTSNGRGGGGPCIFFLVEVLHIDYYMLFNSVIKIVFNTIHRC